MVKTISVGKSKQNRKNKENGKTVLVSSSDDYYDDCSVCQTMKKAEEEGRGLSEEELKKAFAEANKQQEQ